MSHVIKGGLHICYSAGHRDRVHLGHGTECNGINNDSRRHINVNQGDLKAPDIDREQIGRFVSIAITLPERCDIVCTADNLRLLGLVPCNSIAHSQMFLFTGTEACEEWQEEE